MREYLAKIQECFYLENSGDQESELEYLRQAKIGEIWSIEIAY